MGFPDWPPPTTAVDVNSTPPVGALLSPLLVSKCHVYVDNFEWRHTFLTIPYYFGSAACGILNVITQNNW